MLNLWRSDRGFLGGILLLNLGLAFTSCGSATTSSSTIISSSNNVNSVDSAMQGNVTTFMNAATTRVVRFYYNTLNVKFGTTTVATDENGALLCDNTTDTRSTLVDTINVTVDQSKFTALSTLQQEKLILHAMGKFLMAKALNQTTVAIQGASVTYQIPKSVMYSGAVFNYSTDTQSYYLAELFGDKDLDITYSNFINLMDNLYLGK